MRVVHPLQFHRTYYAFQIRQWFEKIKLLLSRIFIKNISNDNKNKSRPQNNTLSQRHNDLYSSLRECGECTIDRNPKKNGEDPRKVLKQSKD